jgi:hypothetical protein
MRSVFKFSFILVIAYVLKDYGPWWIFAPVAFAVSALLPQKGITSFLMAFLAIFVLWFALAISWHNYGAGILTDRIVELIPVGSPWVLMFITALIGGIVSGFSSISGTNLRALLTR